MSKKEIIKKVFDYEFNINDIREEILTKNERKEKKYMFKYLKYALPICLLVITSGILLFNNEEKEPSRENVFINKMDQIGLTRLDADVKEIPTNGLFLLWPEFLTSGLSIPQDLDKTDAFSVYTRKDKNSEYDILNCYVYNYFKDNSNRNIKFAFSNTNKPIRDYYFSDENSKKTTINNHELIIYSYEKLYFAEFQYNNYYFDIETNNITLEEFYSFLKSIIK